MSLGASVVTDASHNYRVTKLDQTLLPSDVLKADHDVRTVMQVELMAHATCTF